MKTLTLLLLIITAQQTIAQDAHRDAPRLTFKDLRGRSVRLGDYRGKVVLLNFWATWCAPCRAESPDLVRLQRDYGARGLQVIGVTYPPETRAAVRSFARRYKINYPIVAGTRATKSLFMASETLPATVVIDREGRVRTVIEGILLPEEFDEKIKPLLDVPDVKGGARQKVRAQIGAKVPAHHADSSFSRRDVVR
jgi:peroxiredoxin